MDFFYVSIFSLIFLALLYSVVLGVFWFIWARILKREFKGPVIWTIVAVVLIAPWLEEFWIAYNFGRLCKKDAGLFITKTIEVKGFYDDTTHWWRQLSESDYQFVESRDRTYGGLWRVERDGRGLRHFKIDRPTARYHYTRNIYGEKVAYKITRQESGVTDTASGEIVGRYVEYGRKPYWFYVSLAVPPFSCDGPDGGPNSKHNSLIYRDVLRPAK